jgi:hypothetical protein
MGRGRMKLTPLVLLWATGAALGAAGAPSPGGVTFRHAVQRVPPRGATHGVVYACHTNGGEEGIPMVEITAGVPGWPVDKRARTVADRLSKLHARMKGWWHRLAARPVGGDFVLSVPGTADLGLPRAAGGVAYVITADPAFARECGQTPRTLAASLISQIRALMDTAKSAAAAVPGEAPSSWVRLATRSSGTDLLTDTKGLSPEAKLRLAVEYRRRGDEEYNEGNIAAALSHYETAVGVCPSYAAARVRLVDALFEKGNIEEARAQLGELTKLSGLGKADLAEIARLEKRLR